MLRPIDLSVALTKSQLHVRVSGDEELRNPERHPVHVVGQFVREPPRTPGLQPVGGHRRPEVAAEPGILGAFTSKDRVSCGLFPRHEYPCDVHIEVDIMSPPDHYYCDALSSFGLAHVPRSLCVSVGVSVSGTEAIFSRPFALLSRRSPSNDF